MRALKDFFIIKRYIRSNIPLSALLSDYGRQLNKTARSIGTKKYSNNASYSPKLNKIHKLTLLAAMQIYT